MRIKNRNSKTKAEQQYGKKERKTTMKKTKITQRRHFKKIAAGALITVMVGTMQVLPVSAKTENCLSSGAGFFASAATAESGSCGENATWTLDTKGRLMISGTGAIIHLKAAWH